MEKYLGDQKTYPIGTMFGRTIKLLLRCKHPHNQKSLTSISSAQGRCQVPIQRGSSGPDMSQGISIAYGVSTQLSGSSLGGWASRPACLRLCVRWSSRYALATSPLKSQALEETCISTICTPELQVHIQLFCLLIDLVGHACQYLAERICLQEAKTM